MSMRNASSRPARPNRFERGIALILVLWVVALLAVIAGSFVYGARSTALVAGNLVSLAKARALADAGVHRGLYELAKPATDAERWKADSRTHAFSLDAAEIRLVMRDESAKIDLNTAPDALLKGLLLSAGLDEEQANQLLDAILDWRDVDELTRPQGAERDRYEALGLPYVPTNAPFQTVDELQRVIGVTPDLYRKLAGALTVFSRSPGINSTLAPRQVLLALPNVTEADVDAYLAQREEMLAAEQVPLPFPQAVGFESGAASQVYNLRSIAKASDGTQFVREAVAKLAPDPKQPFIFLLWQEGRP
ncbi:MAG: general secretion pathway protein GspK [Thiobacillus sp.]|nr:general secretion pathway protein GspK [Thiobacillus sp.]